MKKRIWNLIGIAIMAAAIAFTLIQLKVPVVRASGAQDCPAGNQVFCGNCYLSYALVWLQGNTVITECHYDCYCYGGGGGGEPFYIEQTIQLYD